jgi:hypothetical protein
MAEPSTANCAVVTTGRTLLTMAVEPFSGPPRSRAMAEENLVLLVDGIIVVVTLIFVAFCLWKAR